jgi:hypothetical protein
MLKKVIARNALPRCHNRSSHSYPLLSSALFTS